MEHPNIALVQGLYAAYMGGDAEALRAAFAPDVRWHNSGWDPTSGTLDGPDSVLGYLLGDNHMEDYALEVTDMLASDTRVAIVAQTSGSRDGRRIVNDFVQLIRIADGRVAEVWNYYWDQRAIADFFAAAA